MSSAHEPSAPTLLEFDLLGMLRRRVGHLFMGAVIGLIAAMLHYRSTTPLYESSMTILVGQRSSELTMRGTNNDGFASGSSIQDDILATHIEILQSDLILEDAIVRGDLATAIPALGDYQRSGGRGSDFLRSAIHVQRGGGNMRANNLDVRFTHSDPQAAARVLDSVYEAYREFVQKFSRGQSDEAAEVIVQAQKDLEQELVDAETKYQEFLAQMPVLVDGDSVKDVHRDRLDNLETELTSVRNRIAETISRTDVIENYLRDRSIDEVGDMDHLTLLSEKELQRMQFLMNSSAAGPSRSEMSASMPYRSQQASVEISKKLELYQRQRQLVEEYGPNHPSVLAVMQELAVVEAFLADNAVKEVEEDESMSAGEVLAAYRRLLGNDLEELQRRQTVLLEQIDEEMALAKKVEADFLRGTALKKRVDRAQARYDEVFARLQELNLTSDYAGFSIELLSQPRPPLSPSWPKLPLSLVVGLVLGGLLGMVTGVIAEFADSTFRDAKDLERSVGASILTHVGTFDLKRLREQVDPQSRMSPALCAFHSPRGPESEAYRSARTNLLLANKRQQHQLFMVTSPAPGDGKSTTISNLAISLAQAGKRVLLIDADLRRPTIYNLFGCPDQAGVVDVLTGTRRLSEAIVKSEQNNLSLLTHGTRTGAPSEMFESMEFNRMLEHLRHHFDIIFIDAPPVLAVTDPSIIATLVDATLLTVQVSKNNRRPVMRAIEILNQVDAQMVGVVVNNSDMKTKGYGYSDHRYGYGYGYGGYGEGYEAADAPVPPIAAASQRPSVVPAPVGTAASRPSGSARVQTLA